MSLNGSHDMDGAAATKSDAAARPLLLQAGPETPDPARLVNRIGDASPSRRPVRHSFSGGEVGAKAEAGAKCRVRRLYVRSSQLPGLVADGSRGGTAQNVKCRTDPRVETGSWLGHQLPDTGLTVQDARFCRARRETRESPAVVPPSPMSVPRNFQDEGQGCPSAGRTEALRDRPRVAPHSHVTAVDHVPVRDDRVVVRRVVFRDEHPPVGLELAQNGADLQI